MVSRQLIYNLLLTIFPIQCRYCGYVPQFKYRIGETFGTNTHRLLTSTDPRVAASGNPVLSDTLPSTTHPPKTAEEFFSSPVYQNRTRSWGDQKYVAQMVPGYTGAKISSNYYSAAI